jgi:plastocyanin
VTRLISGTLQAVLAGSVLVACTASAGAGGPPPSAPPGGAVITAQDVAFDRATLVVPAGKSFSLLFQNRDSAPHNVRIFDDDPGQPLFTGEIFGGQDSRTYDVPPIPAGSHRFRCDVHTEMAGTIVAN